MSYGFHMTTTTKAAGLGKALRTLRKSAGMNLEQLAALHGCSISYLSRVETGQAEPSADWFIRVTTILGNALNTQQAAA